MGEEAVAELGFEPGALGRHDAAVVRDGHEVIEVGGMEGEGAGELALADQAFEFGGAADAADELDAFAGAGVVDAEEWGEDMALEQGDVEEFDRVGGLEEMGAEGEEVPLVFEEKAELVAAGGGLGGAGLAGAEGVEGGQELGGG